MQIIVQLSPNSDDNPQSQNSLQQLLQQYHVNLTTMGLPTVVPGAGEYYSTQIDRADEAHQFCHQLQSLPMIQAAYIKPPDGPPN